MENYTFADYFSDIEILPQKSVAEVAVAVEETATVPTVAEDYDFRNFYTKGDVIYLVRNGKIRKLKIRTLYKENIIATEDTGEACQVCLKEREQIFMSNVDAKVYINGEEK